MLPVSSNTNFQASHEENSKDKGKSTCKASDPVVHQLFRGKYLEKSIVPMEVKVEEI